LLVPHLLKHRCFSVRPFTITAPQGARQSTEQSLQDRRRTSVISTYQTTSGSSSPHPHRLRYSSDWVSPGRPLILRGTRRGVSSVVKVPPAVRQSRRGSKHRVWVPPHQWSQYHTTRAVGLGGKPLSIATLCGPLK
jgi:transposase